MKEVALKVIAKKKVKGNEPSVWGEMEVLRGLDHPNIVSLLTLKFTRRTSLRISPAFALRFPSIIT